MKNFVYVGAFTIAALVTVGCGGGGDSGAEPSSSTSSSSEDDYSAGLGGADRSSDEDFQPWATGGPVDGGLQVSCGVRELKFGWPEVSGAVEYRIEASEDSWETFEDLSPALEVRSFEIPVSVHRWNWDLVQYRLVACSENACAAAEPVEFPQGARDCIGFMKAEVPEEGAEFGTAVAVSGDGRLVAVGAPHAQASTGRVTLFEVDESGVWQERETLLGPHEDAEFGASIAMDDVGKLLVVGSPGENTWAMGVDPTYVSEQEDRIGAAFVYRRDGGSFTLTNFIKASNAERDDQFGTSVSVSCDGTLIAVGAPNEGGASTVINGDQSDGGSNSGAYSGAAYLFRADEVTWTQEAYVKAPLATFAFGTAVELSCDGRVLAVGAPHSKIPGSGVIPLGSTPEGEELTRSGTAYAFRLVDEVWIPDAIFNHFESKEFSSFGFSLSLSEDGSLLAVGQESGDETTGAASLFRFDGVVWTALGHVAAQTSGGLTYLGYAVELSRDGSLLLATAIWDSSAGTGLGPLNHDSLDPYSGSIYAYTLTTDGFAASFTAKGKVPGGHDHFGASIALSADGNLLVVGAPGESSDATGVSNTDAHGYENNGSGAVYLF